MTSKLAAAVATLEERAGAGLAAKYLRRCEVDDEGEIVLTLDLPEGTRWFHTRGRDLHERFPEGDGALPSAAWLAALARTGRAQILSWRPGRRIVARVEEDGRARIVKGHRPRRLARALAAQRVAEERVGPEVFSIAPLLAVDPERAALSLGILSGSPLEPPRASRTMLVEIGQRIARLQRSSHAGLSVHGRLDEVALLERASERAGIALDALPDGWRETASRLAALATRAPLDGVAAHRDLHDGQILVDGARLGLLDFDLFANAESSLDPANLAVHLELRILEADGADAPERARVAVDALLEGIERARDPRYAESFAFHCASTALRLSLLCALRPAWARLAAPMLSRAREATESCARS